jgi:short subunit dehydrogenase-like uncharacterized protein
MAAEEFKRRNWGELREVNCYDFIKGSASGGTVKTMLTAMADHDRYKAKCGFDPLLMLPDGSRSTRKYSGKPQLGVWYSNEVKSWTGPFIMSFVMAESVRRSNVLNKYSSDLTYREARAHPNLFAALSDTIGTFAGLTALNITPLRWLMVKLGMLPAPGEGPSEKAMDGFFLVVETVAHGVDADGSTPVELRQTLEFPTDPGYRDTARMLGETALTMILDGDHNAVCKSGGVMTPSVACGSALLDRLVKTGSTYTIVE